MSEKITDPAAGITLDRYSAAVKKVLNEYQGSDLIRTAVAAVIDEMKKEIGDAQSAEKLVDLVKKDLGPSKRAS